MQPSQSKHHSSYSSLCVAWACLHPYQTSVYIPVSVLVFSLSVLQTAGIRSRLNDFNRQGKNKPLWPICFWFYLASALFSTKLISLISCSIWWLSEVLVILDFYFAVTGKVSIVDLCSIVPQPPCYSYGNQLYCSCPIAMINCQCVFSLRSDVYLKNFTYIIVWWLWVLNVYSKSNIWLCFLRVKAANLFLASKL